MAMGLGLFLETLFEKLCELPAPGMMNSGITTLFFSFLLLMFSTDVGLIC